MQMTSYMGVRRGVKVVTSDQRFIEFDQIAIQATQRVAINNVLGDWSIRPTSPARWSACNWPPRDISGQWLVASGQ